MVVGLGCCQIILEMPWLWNPHIDWKSHSLTFSTLFPLCYNERSYHNNTFFAGLASMLIRNLPPYTHNVNTLRLMCLLVSTSLRWVLYINQSRRSTFPSNWPKMQKPPRSLYQNGVMILKMCFPSQGLSLKPKENDTCQVFIDEHLKTSQIIPLKSPQAAPFFFVPKKDGPLCPCQDYCYLNSHTICNAYPLPLIPELIDNMKDSTFFTKFNI